MHSTYHKPQMTILVLNLISQEHSLTTSGTAVSHGKIGRQLRALVRVLQRNVFSTLGQVGEAPAKPSYYLSLVRHGCSTSMWKKKEGRGVPSLFPI